MDRRTELSNFKRIIAVSWPVILIVLLGGISLTWFKAEILAGGDEGLPPPRGILQRCLYSWDPFNPWLGSPAMFVAVNAPPSSQIVPYALLWSSLESVGLPLLVIDRLWIYILFTLPGLCMYYLASTVEVNSKMAKLTSALLYMFNPYLSYALVSAGVLNRTIMLQYITTPLLLAFFKRGLECKDTKYCIYVGLASLLLSTCATNPPNVFSFMDSFTPICSICANDHERKNIHLEICYIRLGLNPPA